MVDLGSLPTRRSFGSQQRSDTLTLPAAIDSLIGGHTPGEISAAGSLRQAQLRVFGHDNLPALAFMPVQHAQHFVHMRIGIAVHAAIVDHQD